MWERKFCFRTADGKQNRKSSIPGLNGPSGNLLELVLPEARLCALHPGLRGEERGLSLQTALGRICPPTRVGVREGVATSELKHQARERSRKGRSTGSPPADGEAVPWGGAERVGAGADTRAGGGMNQPRGRVESLAGWSWVGPCNALESFSPTGVPGPLVQIPGTPAP